MNEDERLLQVAGLSGVIAGIISFLLTLMTGGLGYATEPGFVSGGWPQFLAQWFTNYAPLGEMVGLGMVGLAAMMIYLTLYRTLKITSPNYAMVCLGFGVIASAILVSFLVLRYYAFFSAAVVYNSAAVSEKPTIINMARVLVYSTYGLFFTQGVLWIFCVPRDGSGDPKQQDIREGLLLDEHRLRAAFHTLLRDCRRGLCDARRAEHSLSVHRIVLRRMDSNSGTEALPPFETLVLSVT